MLHIAVCDDERVHRDYTERLVAKAAAGYQPEIDAFDGAEALLSAMSAGDYLPDIAILDIQMAETDGITLAKSLNGVAPLCQIIFLTSFLDFAIDVYDVEHVYFILKRDVETRIGPALNKAISALSSGKRRVPSLTVKSGGVMRVLPVGDVFFLERSGRKTRLVTVTGELWTADTPQTLLQGAPGFIRCHQSYWVNPVQIASMQNSLFLLKNGSQVPISRSYRPEAKAAFFAALREDG